MCGRAYSTVTEEEIEMRYQRFRPIRFPKISANYNISPTHEVPVLHLNESAGYKFDLFKWGLIPFWSKDGKAAFSTINAKAETIEEKPTYRSAFKSRRCIVPLSGFIEWQKTGEKSPKRPFKIHLKDNSIMSVAGIWETWKSKEDSSEIHSFSVITCAANSLMEKIHDRMPVILPSPEAEEIWLNPKLDPTTLKGLLKPCADQLLAAEEISTLINSPKNNRPEVLDPLAAIG